MLIDNGNTVLMVLVLRAHLVTLEHQDEMEILEPLGQWVHLDLLASLDHLDYLEGKDHLDQLEIQDVMEHLDFPEALEHLVRLSFLVPSLDHCYAFKSAQN